MTWCPMIDEVHFPKADMKSTQTLEPLQGPLKVHTHLCVSFMVYPVEDRHLHSSDMSEHSPSFWGVWSGGLPLAKQVSIAITSTFGVKWWQIMTRRQGHRETVRLWKCELKRCCSLECIKSVPYVKLKQVSINCKAHIACELVERLVMSSIMCKLLTAKQVSPITAWKCTDNLPAQCTDSLNIQLFFFFAHHPGGTDVAVEQIVWKLNHVSTSDISTKIFLLPQKFSKPIMCPPPWWERRSRRQTLNE